MTTEIDLDQLVDDLVNNIHGGDYFWRGLIPDEVVLLSLRDIFQIQLRGPAYADTQKMSPADKTAAVWECGWMGDQEDYSQLWVMSQAVLTTATADWQQAGSLVVKSTPDLPGASFEDAINFVIRGQPGQAVVLICGTHSPKATGRSSSSAAHHLNFLVVDELSGIPVWLTTDVRVSDSNYSLHEDGGEFARLIKDFLQWLDKEIKELLP